MVISTGLDLPHGISQSPIWKPGHVRSWHLMTLTLHTRWTLSGFCLHSHRNEVLGAHVYQSWWGSSCSPVSGLTSTAALTNCLWIVWSSASPPSTLFLSLSPDKCSSAAFPRHGRPYLLLLTIQRGVLASCSSSQDEHDNVLAIEPLSQTHSVIGNEQTVEVTSSV